MKFVKFVAIKNATNYTKQQPRTRRLMDENGMEVFNTSFGCTGPGVQTLTTGGTYTLTVGNRIDPSTGNYAFEIGTR